jgi:hypothetical protein
MLRQFADLHHLKKALDSKVLAVIVVGVSFVFIFDPAAFSLILKIIIVACILFVPFMLYVLYLHDKKIWIAGFSLLMAVSLLPSVFIDFESTVTGYLMNYLPLLSFLIYCCALNLKAGEWIIETQYK